MRWALLSAAAALAVLAPRRAAAQPSATTDEPYLQQDVAPPARAFELTVATGYAQGFGTLEPGVGVPRVAKGGIGIDASAGFRIDPHYAVSLGGQYQELDAQRDDSVRAFALDLALQCHVSPSTRVDPWLEIGSGYRVLWLEPFSGATTVLEGPQLLRARVGLDLRVSPSVALAPVIGADATMFVFRDERSLDAIARPTVSTFVFAGLQGRVDIGGQGSPKPQ
jgi:hypothetical protein